MCPKQRLGTIFQLDFDRRSGSRINTAILEGQEASIIKKPVFLDQPPHRVNRAIRNTNVIALGATYGTASRTNTRDMHVG